MSFDKDRSEWKLSNVQNPEYFAIIQEYDYPFGIRNWQIHNDTCKQNRFDQIKKMQLSFNVCNAKEEFNCDDGTW